MVKDERKTVYVKNLPYRANEDDIFAFFSQAGPVADVRRGAEADGGQHSIICSTLSLLHVGCECHRHGGTQGCYTICGVRIQTVELLGGF